MREDLESEWHSRVASASDSRCGEQVLNIKATQQRTWANGPYWYGTSQAGTHTQSHTHSHARMQIYRHHRRVASHHSGRAKQKEHACLIHNLPFQHVRVLILRTVTPNPQALSPTHQDVGIQKEEMNKVGKEWVSTYSGEVKPTTFLISPSGLSVMEVQHSKLTRFLSWVYTCPFFPMNSVFPERVSFLTAHHPTSQDYAWLFHTDKHWREMMRRQRPGKSEREGERQGAREGLFWHWSICFHFGKKNGFGIQK